MKKVIEYAIIILGGGILYMILEVLWRGHTHWTMGIAGGLSFAVIYFVHNEYSHINIFLRAVICSLCITAIELLTGLVVNVYLGWNVWDYSGRYLNFLGQICPLYTVLWTLLCVIASPVCKIINCLIHRHLEGMEWRKGKKTLITKK